jgi:alpha-glucoside transport system permease protein
MAVERLLLTLGVVLIVPAVVVGYIVLAEAVLGHLPKAQARAVRPWLWLTPALTLLFVFLLYPSLNTLVRSFLNADSSAPVGLANYQYIVTDPTMLVALRNNVIWVVIFTSVTVALGLGIAVVVDRVRYEAAAKATIFLPMAISFVAAGVIWRFMYDFRPPGVPQTGTVNAFLMFVVPGFQPQAWLANNPPFNNLAIIAAAVWIWTGFCMVILSAGLKGIPVELIEASRVDGASELQAFRHVIVPMLGSTIAVVATTMVIFALKAFDLVYVMTNGNFETEVIANRMYKEMFNVHNFGRASAIAVLLLAAIVPVMLLNIRRFRQQEEIR